MAKTTTKEKAEGESQARKVARAHAKGDYTIKLRVKENPKRPGSQTRARFALYKDGMTVTEALSLGITSRDIAWDSDTNAKRGPDGKGFIELVPPKKAAA